jgi:hypothetical protein
VANDGIQRGGNDKGTSEHVKQRYFCPTANLADCQPTGNNQEMVAENQRPCRKGDSPIFGEGKAGGPLHVAWPANGHANEQADGTCVKLGFAPYSADPDYSSVKFFQDCLPYTHGDRKTFADVTIPSDMRTGKYTLFWMWDFASFWFSSCIDFNIQGTSGGSSGSSSSNGAKPATTTAEPAKDEPVQTTALPEHEQTTALPEHEETKSAGKATGHRHHSSKAGAETDLEFYKKNGCGELGSDYCRAHFTRKSYCMSFKADKCGRSICHGGRYSHMTPCNKGKLLL